MAHLPLHLMFRGTPTAQRALGTLKRGARNGTTSFDRTNFFASFSANDDTLKWYLGLAGRRDGAQPLIARSDLDTEMTVVRNDGARREQPGRAVLQHLLSAVLGGTTTASPPSARRRRRERGHLAPAAPSTGAGTSPTTRRSSSPVASTPRRRWPGWPNPSGRSRARSKLEPTYAGPGAGRRAHGHRAAAGGRLAARLRWASTCRQAPRPTSRRWTCWPGILGDAPAGRLHKRLVEASWRRPPSASAGRWPSRAADPGAPARPRAGRRQGRAALAGDAGGVAEGTHHRRRTGTRAHPVAQTVGAGLHRPRAGGLAAGCHRQRRLAWLFFCAATR